MAIQKVWMACIDVTRLHRHQIFNQLVGWLYRLAEEGDDSLVESLLQLRISSENLLSKKLTEDANKFIVDQ